MENVLNVHIYVLDSLLKAVKSHLKAYASTIHDLKNDKIKNKQLKKKIKDKYSIYI